MFWPVHSADPMEICAEVGRYRSFIKKSGLTESGA